MISNEAMVSNCSVCFLLLDHFLWTGGVEETEWMERLGQIGSLHFMLSTCHKTQTTRSLWSDLESLELCDLGNLRTSEGNKVFGVAFFPNPSLPWVLKGGSSLVVLPALSPCLHLLGLLPILLSQRAVRFKRGFLENASKCNLILLWCQVKGIS